MLIVYWCCSKKKRKLSSWMKYRLIKAFQFYSTNYEKQIKTWRSAMFARLKPFTIIAHYTVLRYTKLVVLSRRISSVVTSTTASLWILDDPNSFYSKKRFSKWVWKITWNKVSKCNSCEDSRSNTKPIKHNIAFYASRNVNQRSRSTNLRVGLFSH